MNFTYSIYHYARRKRWYQLLCCLLTQNRYLFSILYFYFETNRFLHFHRSLSCISIYCRIIQLITDFRDAPWFESFGGCRDWKGALHDCICYFVLVHGSSAGYALLVMEDAANIVVGWSITTIGGYTNTFAMIRNKSIVMDKTIIGSALCSSSCKKDVAKFFK